MIFEYRLYKCNVKVQFLNTYYHCLVDQVHQLHVIEGASLIALASIQKNEKKGKKTQNSGVIVTIEVSSFTSERYEPNF